MEKPKKLVEELEKVSEEHYEVLLFGWKLAEGLRNNIETKRLKAYADWFFEHYLLPHFNIEKEYIFPVLGLDNVRIKRALANHRRLKRLIKEEEDIYRSLNLIEEEIGRFIRFEERVLLKQIQEKATPAELKKIEEKHQKINLAEKEWKDPFWES